jgi:acetylornithine aminotransferase
MNKDSKTLRMKMFAGSGVSLTVEKAVGTRVLSKEYGELNDFESGCWAAVLGHSRKEITEVIQENVGQLFHTHQFFDTEHPSALVAEITAAAKLKTDYKGTFMSSGSEAVSLGVLLSELLTGRKKKLCFSISYLGSSPELRMPRRTEEWLDLAVLECLDCDKECNCSDCGKFSAVAFEEMAAFVFEPGNSGGLVLCPPQKLIGFLSEKVRAAGGYVVVNEVTTGFGRTGKWFGFQHYESLDSEIGSPDFIAMGKGLGNGYPISGLLVKPILAEAIEASGFRHVQSHTDDPLGCLVSRKVVEVMVKENLVERGNEVGAYLRSALSEIAEDLPSGIKAIRGRGMMNVVVLHEPHKAKAVFWELLKSGFFTGYSEQHNFIHLYAPLITEVDHIDGLCKSLQEILRR